MVLSASRPFEFRMRGRGWGRYVCVRVGGCVCGGGADTPALLTRVSFPECLQVQVGDSRSALTHKALILAIR